MSATKQHFAVCLHPYLSPIRQLRRYHIYTISAAVFVTFMPCYCIEIYLMRLRSLRLPPPLDISTLCRKISYTSPHVTHHARLTFRFWPCLKRFLLRDSLRTSQIGLLSSVFILFIFVFILLIFGPAITLSLITPNFLSIHRIRRFPTDASMGPTFAARVHLP